MNPFAPPLFLSRLLRWLMVLALCFSIGLQWVVLQGIAWTGMLIEFSQTDTLAAAVEKTFDGEHPCPLCKAVQEGKKKEGSDKSQDKNPLKKLEALVIRRVSLLPPPGVPVRYVLGHEYATTRPTMPLLAPPRCGLI